IEQQAGIGSYGEEEDTIVRPQDSTQERKSQPATLFPERPSDLLRFEQQTKGQWKVLLPRKGYDLSRCAVFVNVKIVAIQAGTGRAPGIGNGERDVHEPSFRPVDRSVLGWQTECRRNGPANDHRETKTLSSSAHAANGNTRQMDSQ